jgi:hypothetical protein
VLAQVPDLNSFVEGIAALLARRGGDDRVPAPDAAGRGEPVRHDLPRALLVLLVPDTTVRGSWQAHGLEVFDVEELWTHGGSLRVYADAAAATGPAERLRWRAARA